MAARSSKALHEQLCIIMGALTKAAVAEICEVVDEGYAVLHMEITRSHKENEDLKKKLHLIESIVLRGNSGEGKAGAAAAVAPAAAEPAAAPTAEGAQQPETPPRQQQQQQQQADGDGRDPAADPAGDGGASITVVLREELPDVVLIKDEDSDSNDSFEEDNRAAADGATAAAREAVPSTPISRSKKRRWPGSEAGDRKSSPGEQLTPKASKATAAPQKKSVSVYALDSPRGELGRSGQLGDEMEACESVCSYSSQMDPDVQLVQPECSLVPPTSTRQAAYFTSSALMESQSPTNRAELDLSLTWTKQSKGQMSFSQFHPSENPDNDAFGIKLVSVSGSASTESQLSEGSNSAFEYDNGDMMSYAVYREQSHHAQQSPAARGKRFVCAVCNRTYATAQNLDVHMRIHTGERPFSCEQCGKKFTQSAHLKSHLSVHSGERPHACTVCSRSFIVKYSLKLHMKKCHPNVIGE